ncbi:LysE family translocator [Methanolobus profundi]|uniref:Threonine/homoserine/homoserine lactone efflux protein n=1 Tax=Methanolobus profundi TaxID=487685 RepID=A0A1I4TU93_9EURY|nr:LysE family translocator [Methanolobus profundi]SFM80145.1 Threonine/homoserine/homoserine lactone efflux protein [Methanolobus profundi]
MIETTQLLYFIAVSVALTLLPGPDILFVLTQSISQGKKAGMAIAFGLCTGLLFHTTAAALGVSAILYSSAVAFSILKYAGAIYLLYLAYNAIREEGTLASLGSLRETELPLLYRRGIFMNILNPKVSLFFLAFLPQFVSVDSGNIPMQMVFLGAVFFLQAIVVFFIVSFFAGMIGNRIMERPGLGKKINWAKAGIYSVIGIELALSHQ